jgi:molybdopterin-guanine dinucleotide biosynthesis protein A
VSSARSVRGYVLAGGASSRFGSDKALAEVQGKSMVVRTVDLLSKVCENVAIVAQKTKLSDGTARTIVDRWPGEGPLGGILTALLDVKQEVGEGGATLIVSCDMPFLNEEWLRFLAERASESQAEAVVPKSRHGWEPLCSCWRVSAAEIVVPLFEAGTRKVTEALNVLHVEVLDEKDWKRFDTSGRLFWNMNTAADYQEALHIFHSGNS